MTDKQFFNDRCTFIDRKAFNRKAGTKEYEKQAKVCGRHYGIIMTNPYAKQKLIFNFNKAEDVLNCASYFDPNLLYFKLYVVDWTK